MPPLCSSTLLPSRLGAALLLGLALATGQVAEALSYESVYPVSELRVEYALDHPGHPPEQEILDLEVGLRAGPEAYVAPRPVDRTVRMRLSALPQNASFGASALLHINQHIVATLNRLGFNGVIVTVPDIEEGSGRDLRPPGETALRLRIWTGRVARVASVADGERFGGLRADERTHHAAHAWIRARSPVRPGGPRGLLDVAALEDYAAWLSRHPGRRVDVELEPGPRVGTSDVTLRIAESKPWYAYAQYTNTGTKSTTRHRQRFGFAHNQLLSRDDVLRLDYSTGNFDEVHAAVGSYEAPFTQDAPLWRWRVHGWWSRFRADARRVPSRFEGEELAAGAELSRQLLQRGPLFVDAAAGARWQRMEVTSRQFLLETARADVQYVVPHAELRAERDTATASLRAALGASGGIARDEGDELELIANPEIDLFGTADADADFALLTFDGSLSFFLEPLLDRAAWENPETPESSTLAHEVALAARGQWALGHRLVPQFQQTAGGFYTVRGYTQSVVSGDDLALGSVEYRLHLPRLLAPDATPPEIPGMGPFRARPPHLWAAPDWDFILRVFSDAAYVRSSGERESEPAETLWSVGAGAELQVLRNLTLRAEVGHVLSDLQGGGISTKGDTRGHLAATLLY